MKYPSTILLTATIRPANFSVSSIQRTDIVTRIADYVAALRFWGAIVDARIDGIVFCENSGEDLTTLKTAARDFDRQVEFLSFQDDRPPANVHYGYGEFGIIDFAIRNSALLRNARYFLKSTGRLTFPTISTLLDSLPDDVSGAADHRFRYRREAGPPSRVRTQLMLFSTEFYRSELLGCRTEMVGLCSHMEEFLAIKLGNREFSPPFLRRFPVECPPSGVSGSGSDYDSFRNRCKSSVRAVARKWFPQLWW